MHIDRVDLYHTAMSLLSPWRTAYGEDEVIESVLVQMTSGDQSGCRVQDWRPVDWGRQSVCLLALARCSS